MSGVKARMSALPVLQYCGQAQRLGESLGAGRAAAIGTAFHAKCSGHPNASAIISRLSDEELEELEQMRAPSSVCVADEVWLTYADAHKEVPVGIDEKGKFVEYDDDSVLLRGTVDFYWVVTAEGRTTVYVADIKRTAYAAPDGPASLQVIGYALALVSLHNADAYCTAIWDATEGQWEWSGLVDTWSEQAERDWERVKASALNHGGEYSVGTHCRGCYGRKRCPQWLLPLDLVGMQLEPFTTEGGITQEKALEALTLAQRAEDTAKAVTDILKHFARENDGLFDPATGKKWAPIKMKGRQSFDVKSLEKDNPELAQRYFKQGNPYEQFRMIKADK